MRRSLPFLLSFALAATALAIDTKDTRMLADPALSADGIAFAYANDLYTCLLYTSPSPRDQRGSRMPSSA